MLGCPTVRGNNAFITRVTFTDFETMRLPPSIPGMPSCVVSWRLTDQSFDHYRSGSQGLILQLGHIHHDYIIYILYIYIDRYRSTTLDLHFPFSSGLLARIVQLRLHAIDFVGQVTRADSPMAKRVGSLDLTACAAQMI